MTINLKKYKIDAVHTVCRRIIASNLNEEEKNDLIKELLKAGYEKENIIVERIDGQS